MIMRRSFKPTNRTIARAKRREAIRIIIDNFITIYSNSDNELERLPLLKLMNIKLDTMDFLEWLRLEYREGSGTHIWTNRVDAAAKASKKNAEGNEH